MKRKFAESFLRGVTGGRAAALAAAVLAAAFLLPAPAPALDAPARPLMKREPRPLPLIKTMPNRPGLAAPAHAYDFSGVRMEYDRMVPGTLPAQGSRSETHFNPDGSVRSYNRGPLAAEVSKMWTPGTTLTVKMMGGSARVRTKVRQYAEEWTRHANIRFQFVEDSQPAVIKIGFGTDGTSWSTVGRDALLVPFDFETMHFGWFDDNTPEDEFSRTVLHEFGHALGLIHEHQSPAAGIPWDKEKVYAFFQQQDPPWDRGRVDSNIFNRYSASTTNFSQYDPTSIMQYSYPASLTLNGQGTPFNTVLSANDKKYIAQWYPWPHSDSGELRTGDDCDQIGFQVEYGVEDRDKVRFRLGLGAGLTWWKMVEVPVGGGQYANMEVQDNVRSAERLLDKVSLDGSRTIRFSKAKLLGAHTRLGYGWDAINHLPGGSRVTLNWVNDHCR